MSSQNIVGMEALVRWNHPTRGLLAPGLFIPIAEKTGTIIALGRWILDQACRQMRLWRDEGLILPVIAINLSLVQLKGGQELVRDVTETIAKWGLAPSDLEFDVTEATLAQLTWTQNDVLPQLRELGVKVAIDDFGSEYSSFDYVRAYRVNHLKIAQSFISRSTSDPESAATIRAIVNFAHDVGIVVIAQGVETEQQRDLLTSTDALTQAQGFHFSKAVGADRAGEFLRQRRILAAGDCSSEHQATTPPGSLTFAPMRRRHGDQQLFGVFPENSLDEGDALTGEPVPPQRREQRAPKKQEREELSVQRHGPDTGLGRAG